MTAGKSPKARLADQMKRRFLLDVYANGAVTIRARGQKNDGGLPVYSTDTREQAEDLIVFHCRLARDHSGVYYLNEFDRGNVEDLVRVGNLFQATHERWVAEGKVSK